MNEVLEKSLATLIDKSMTGLDTATGFLEAEIPEYVTQLLTWYAVYNLALCLLGFIFLGLFIWAGTSKHFKKGKRKDPDSSYEHYEPTLAFDFQGSLRFEMCFAAFPIIFGALLVAKLINIEWLQIWIAPKVWLLEYASKIVS